MKTITSISSTKADESGDVTFKILKILSSGFPGGAVVENLPANAGTRVRALVWEDPTCYRATGPMSHNYLACTSGACAPQQERPR